MGFLTAPGCKCCVCGVCEISGAPFTTTKYKLEVSGIASSITYTEDRGQNVNGDWVWSDVTVTGLDGFNGTYFIEIGTDDSGCPTGCSPGCDSALKSVNASFSWTNFFDCDNPTESTSGTHTCDYELYGEGGWTSSDLFNAFFLSPFDTSCQDWGANDPTPCAIDLPATWTAPGDCDKLPDGTETFTGEVTIVNNQGSPCVTQGTVAADSFSAQVTAMFS